MMIMELNMLNAITVEIALNVTKYNNILTMHKNMKHTVE